MAIKEFTNNATTLLAAGITTTATSCQVTSGTGSLFPTIGSGTGNTFTATIQRIVGGTVTLLEIVSVVARAGDTMIMVRGQESTNPGAWNAGDTFALLPTAGDFASFVQPAQAQEFSYNFAQDTGTANNYSVVLNPALTAHVIGMPIIWQASHSNTGIECTFNDGVGETALLPASPVVYPMPVGTIQANGMYITVWDGTFFRLLAQPSGSSLQISNNLDDVANASTSLANIGGNNASNLTTGTLAYARTGGSVLLASNGYEIFPSNRIEQWGLVSATGSSPIVVTFPTPFPNFVLNLEVTPASSTASFYAQPINLHEFEIGTGSTTTNFYWRATGY